MNNKDKLEDLTVGMIVYFVGGDAVYKSEVFSIDRYSGSSSIMLKVVGYLKVYNKNGALPLGRTTSIGNWPRWWIDRKAIRTPLSILMNDIYEKEKKNANRTSNIKSKR